MQMEPLSKDQPPSTNTITMTTASSCRVPPDEKKAANRKVKPYGCVLCKKAFSRAMNLQKHMIEAHGVTEESEDDDEEEEEEEEEEDGNGCIQGGDDDSINLFADAAASVLGDISGESRDNDEPDSHCHPPETSQKDIRMNSDQHCTESMRDGTDVAIQKQATMAIQAALQLNPSDIIAQAAAGANILVSEIEKEGDMQETQYVGVDVETRIIPEIRGFSNTSKEPSNMRDDANLYLLDQTAITDTEDGVSLQMRVGVEGSQCNETMPHIIRVPESGVMSSKNKMPPTSRRTTESSQTPIVTVNTFTSDCAGGKVQTKNLHKKKTGVSSSCTLTSGKAATLSNKVLRSRKPTLQQITQESKEQEQALATDHRPQLRRSRRSPKRKKDKDFLTEQDDGMKGQIKKHKKESKKKGQEKKREKEKQTSKELDVPEQPTQCTGTKRKRKTLNQKLADLHRAHEETEKLNILVQKMTSERRGGKTETKEFSMPHSKRTSPSSTKTKTKKTFDCLSCQEKFHSLSECIDHMRRAHLPSKTSPVESEEHNSSSYISSDVEEAKKKEVDDAEETPKTSKRSSRAKVAKRKCLAGSGEYLCQYCREVSKSVEGQRAHMSVHCGIEEGKCFKCKIYECRPTAAQLADIERSVEKVRDATNADGYEFKHGKRLLVQFYQCIVCNSCFAVEKHLRNHMSQHKVFVCQVCEGVFSSTQALGKHIPHHKTGPLSCRTCGQTFFSSYMLLMHMRGHTNDFRCKHCDTTFMFPANLLRHIKQRHTNETNCDPASVEKVASQHERSSKHKDRTRGTKEKAKLNCRFCGNLHFSEKTLKRHIETYHPDRAEDPGKFVCELCGTVRHKFSQLRAHMICHNQPEQKCQLCTKVFLRPFYLKQHIQQVHAGRRDYTCQYCGKRISSSTSLQDHERLHTGEKPFVCLQCGKSFRVRQMYKTHLRSVHSKDKPFTCLECGKCFFSCTSLAKHKKIHTPKEDSVCPDCGKRFKRKDLLRMHLVQHRQALHCFKCNRRFSSDIALKYHMDKVHKINLYRTNQLNVSEGLLHASHLEMSTAVQDLSSVADISGGLASISASPDKNPNSVTVLHGDSKADFADLSGNRVDCSLPAQATIVPSNNLPISYGTDRRLSDPTNVAISTIISQLFERTLASVAE